MNHSSANFLSADRAISKLDDDKLGRSGYARAIARSISTWKGEESLVVALYGGWGDGKSSVLGMVEDALRKDETSCPIIVAFNPWEWAGQNQLAQVFFDEIGKQIAEEGIARSTPHAQETGSKMRAFGKHLLFGASLATVVKYFPNLARLVNYGAVPQDSQAQIEGAIATIEPYTDTVAQVGSAALKKVAEISEQGAEATEQSTAKESLRNVKAALAADLKMLGKNVLVVLDDVDRLDANEIRLLFQLVKANSDFSNLIFLLAFQRDIIEAALEKTIATGSGKDYLEKIVQVPLDLPEIQRPLLEGVVMDRLSRLIEKHKLDSAFDRPRFKELWKSGLSCYFQNLRDVYRFFGTFEFQMGVFASPVEFNTVDLFALEVLRLFEASLYRQIVVSRSLLCPSEIKIIQFHLDPNDPTKKWADIIKKVVEFVKPANPDAAKVILKGLFPEECFAGEWKTSERPIGFQRKARVAHPSFFNRYFSLCVPQGDVSQVELLGLKESMAKASDFKERLTALHAKGLASLALDRLLEYADEFDSNNAGTFVLALYDTVDALDEEYSERLSLALIGVSDMLVISYIDKVSNQTERFNVLKKVLEKTKSIYLPSFQITREASRIANFRQDKEPGGMMRKEWSVLEDDQLNQLITIYLKRLSEAAKSGKLKKHPYLNDTLTTWWHLRQDDKGPKDYCQELSETDDGLFILLEQFMHLSPDGEVSLNEIIAQDGPPIFSQPFIDINHLKKRVEQIQQTNLTSRQHVLCKTFLTCHNQHVFNQSKFPSPTTQDKQEVRPSPSVKDSEAFS